MDIEKQKAASLARALGELNTEDLRLNALIQNAPAILEEAFIQWMRNTPMPHEVRLGTEFVELREHDFMQLKMALSVHFKSDPSKAGSALYTLLKRQDKGHDQAT